MANSSSFIDHVREQCAPLGVVTVRRMFSGAAVYCDGQVFALINDDVAYFKSDEQSRPLFVAEGMGPFCYATKHGEQVLTSYWRVPERLFDEPDELRVWVREALAAGRRAATKKATPKVRAVRTVK
jgi:DNA transformation protein and related proteins